MEKLMKLEKLSEHNLLYIEGKQIICFGCPAAYLAELEQKFPNVAASITAVYDENVRDQRSSCIGRRRFPIISKDDLAQVSYQDTMWLILNDYFQEYYEKLSKIEVVRNSSDMFLTEP